MQNTFSFDIVDANNQRYYFICQEQHDKHETYYYVKCTLPLAKGKPEKQETFEMRIDCVTGNFKIQNIDNLTPDVIELEQAVSDKICGMDD